MSSDQKEALSEEKKWKPYPKWHVFTKQPSWLTWVETIQKSKSQTEQDFSSKSHSSAKQVVSQLQFNFDKI